MTEHEYASAKTLLATDYRLKEVAHSLGVSVLTLHRSVRTNAQALSAAAGNGGKSTSLSTPAQISATIRGVISGRASRDSKGRNPELSQIP